MSHNAVYGFCCGDRFNLELPRSVLIAKPARFPVAAAFGVTASGACGVVAALAAACTLTGSVSASLLNTPSQFELRPVTG